MLLQKAEMDQATERASELATEGHLEMARALQSTFVVHVFMHDL